MPVLPKSTLNRELYLQCIAVMTPAELRYEGGSINRALRETKLTAKTETYLLGMQERAEVIEMFKKTRAIIENY